MSQYQSPFEEKLYNERRDKLAQIAALGERLGLSHAESIYPNSFAFTHTIPQLRPLGLDNHGDPQSAEALEAAPIEAAIAGRIMAIRVQGKAGFATLQQDGQRLQIYVRKDDVGASPEQSEALFALYKLLDLGDHIGVRGHLMRTRTGELTLKASPIHLPGHEGQPALAFLAKAMLALPDKFHGLEDTELRYRQRYLDLIVNSGTRETAAPPSVTPSNLSSRPESSPLIAPLPNLSSRPESSPLIAPPPNLSSRPESSPLIAPLPNLSSRPESASFADAAERPAAPPAPGTQPPPSATEPETPNVRETFAKRAAILRSIRRFFDTRGYLEVETPMLHTIAGGAAARPFKTHHNALDIPLSLRIAPELFLKRLVVGGLDRVYEINRNFRNEGVSTQHNPEFTMLEFYQAYANYHDLMDLTQELITSVAQEVNGTTTTHFPIPKGPRAGEVVQIDLAKWERLSMREAIRKYWRAEYGESPTEHDFSDAEAFGKVLHRAYLAADPMLTKQANTTIVEIDPGHFGPVINMDQDRNALQNRFGALSRLEIEYVKALSSTSEMSEPIKPASRKQSLGKSIAALFEILSEEHLIQPTIIYDFPLAVSPLSKVKPDEPDWVERFEFYIGGFEVGNAFSELNDPDDQYRRFEAQLKERDRGDDEAHAMDEDYVRALGYGLPPTAGEGVGIDRLTMILTGSRSIRDVILFPLMRPHKSDAPQEAEPTE